MTAPRRRRLRVFAFDPMTSRLSGGTITLDVPWERLEPGPVGALLQVVDTQPSAGVWYRPVDLDDVVVAHQDGLAPSESDPRSHQQAVYAVASSVIERFERFLGRRFRWRSDERLLLLPHAFEGRNAYFDPTRRAVLFGYFRADAVDPGRNLPSQLIFTCLSLDIVAHEVTHALVHRLRRYYIEATNPDVLAWHEAFADLVALFHHFVLPEVVRDAVTASSSDLLKATELFDLAAEFGESTGRGGALRSALRASSPADSGPAALTTYHETLEPHERGAIFVAAIFDAYIQSYRRSIADLLRIATGGTGVLPEGHLHPDLVARVTKEAVAMADRFLGMVIRAFDYLPVVDVTFSDVLRAIITADRDLHPDDGRGMRSTLIESFRQRGIYPTDTTSLAEEALAWPRPRGAGIQLPPDVVEHLCWLVSHSAQELDPEGEPLEEDLGRPTEPPRTDTKSGGFAVAMLGWAKEHALELGFSPDTTQAPLALVGRHVSFREAQDRQPQPEVVVQIAQRRRDLEDQHLDVGTRPRIRAGTTLIITTTGFVRYVIAKPLPLHARRGRSSRAGSQSPAVAEQARARYEQVRRCLGAAEDYDSAAAWSPLAEPSRTFQRLHLQIETEDR